VSWRSGPKSRTMPLADPNCPACITFEDGGDPCPHHEATYADGMTCPVCGSDRVMVAQYGAAYLCLGCEE
jgi:hypothetical protein